MSTVHTAISVGTTAVTVVPARPSFSYNAPLNPLKNNSRLVLKIQSYGSPEYPSNPTFWVAFGQTAVVGGAGSIQVVTGDSQEWGIPSPTGNPVSSACPQGYISIVGQSGTAVGAVIEELV